MAEMDRRAAMAEDGGRRNRPIVIACAAFVAAMVGMAYAAVPLYELFCQVTGYGGTTQRAETAYGEIIDTPVKVRFDANTRDNLAWDFRPVEREVTLKMGETATVLYQATNLSDRPIRGQATFNVTPLAAGAYFNKVECFCFTETELQPGETMDMPVVFFVDPAMVDEDDLKNIRTLTLSYTFYRLKDDGTFAEAGKAVGSDQSSL